MGGGRPDLLVLPVGLTVATDPGIRRYTCGTGPAVSRLISGRSTGRRPTLRATIEDQMVVVAGPRTGKTTSIVTPGIVDHQGPVLATSNKRDIVVTTRPVGADVGTVWTFGPQAIATSELPGWWWDPLSICGDVRWARKVAAIWVTAKQKPGERDDIYSGPEGTDLVAGLVRHRRGPRRLARGSGDPRVDRRPGPAASV